MSRLAFVMSPLQAWPLRELAATLRYELEQQGLPSTVHMGAFPAPDPGTVYVLVSPREYVAVQGDGALQDEETLGQTIFLSGETPNTLAGDGAIKLFRRAGAVFDINPQSVACLGRAGVAARHLRPGYSKLRDRFDPAAERAIDVMFLGSHSLRRTKLLSSAARILARHNCLLQIADDCTPNTRDSSSFLGESKWGLLEHTRIALNLHRGEDSQFEWLRVLDAIHTGAVVVTEPSSGMSPLVPGEHLLVAGRESLPFVLEAALRDEERLARLRRQAHEHIREALPFALAASEFRAVALELGGGPVSRDASPGRRGTGPNGVPPSAEEDRIAAAVRHEVEEVNLEVVELRSRLARLERTVRSGAQAHHSPTRLLHESPAWSARRSPEVSVLITISDGAPTIRPVLESLARAMSRNVELVVVDDGSTDGTSEVARDWLHIHPQIPSRLIGHSFERGLGSARNTALQFARAPNSLILNAAMEVYPRCLDVLTGTLAGIPDAAFAYPMLEVIGLADEFVAAGGDYLLNVFGWEPDRLRARAPIEALAMIRTESLRELGGFATDPLMAGWEDHDLWRRVADRGWRGQLVPQVLGRYRAVGAVGQANLRGR